MVPTLSILHTAENLLRTSIAPNAEAIDQDPQALRWALYELGKANLLGLRLPADWGGSNADTLTFHHFQALMARYSGSLAFLQAQHQSAGSLLLRSQNSVLQHKYLPYLSSGQMLIGISFAHLRREISPVKAVAMEGGYQLDGQSPWVTGWGFFHQLIVAAELPDGQVVYGMVPFQTTQQPTGGELVCSPPLCLAAMNATHTVTVDLQRWWLPESQVVDRQPAAALAQSDRHNVLHPAFYAIGCAQAGVDLLANLAAAKGDSAIAAAHQHFAQAVETCRQQMICAAQRPDHFAENLSLRARSIALAQRCAQAGIVAASGAANRCDHPAQRIYREALAFAVSGQTTAVLEATLQHLIST